MFNKTFAIAFAVIGTQALNIQQAVMGGGGAGEAPVTMGGEGTYPTGLAQNELVQENPPICETPKCRADIYADGCLNCNPCWTQKCRTDKYADGCGLCSDPHSWGPHRDTCHDNPYIYC